MSHLNVVLSADSNHAPYAAAVIRSAVMSADISDRFIFFIFTMGITENDTVKFSQLSEELSVPINVITVEEKLVENLPDNGRTKTAYLRIFAGILLPHIENVIYLDTDILVRCSLSEVLEYYDAEKSSAAVIDATVYTKWKGLTQEVPSSFDKTKYFNSGVMLINLNFFRQKEVHKNVPELRRSLTSSILHDQSALNIFLEGTVSLIPVKYNYMVDIYDNMTLQNDKRTNDLAWAYSDPKIVHFSNYKKPWHRRFPQRFAAEYREHLCNTPWGKDALPKLSFRNHIGRVVRLFSFYWLRLRYHFFHILKSS